MTDLLNNDLLLYCLIPGTLILISGYYLKTKLFSTVIETPNSPHTYNLTHEQIQEIEEFFLTQEELDEMEKKLNRGEQLDQLENENLNQTMENILGTDEYNNMTQELKDLEKEMMRELENILTNSDLF